jgi:hypothetical protein
MGEVSVTEAGTGGLYGARCRLPTVKGSWRRAGLRNFPIFPKIPRGSLKLNGFSFYYRKNVCYGFTTISRSKPAVLRPESETAAMRKA